MTQRDKLIQKIFRHGQVSAEEATRLLVYLGYQVEQDSTSHKVFRKTGHPTLSLKN